jgi:hypothetical protein
LPTTSATRFCACAIDGSNSNRGYDVVAIGEDRGQRTINQAEAEIIRRIFRDYVDGRSALDIAGRLNRERIAAPRGREWNASTINARLAFVIPISPRHLVFRAHCVCDLRDMRRSMILVRGGDRKSQEKPRTSFGARLMDELVGELSAHRPRGLSVLLTAGQSD